MKRSQLSLWAKLRAYRLDHNVYVVLMLLVSVCVSVAVYMLPAVRDVKFLPELALAIATSLLATIFAVAADIYVKYKSHKNDQFLEGIHEFGISNLHFNKQELLEKLLEHSDNEVWISGYRLILTCRIVPGLVEAAQRGVRFKLLVSPPWGAGFKAVYGEQERVMDNYHRVLTALAKACPDIASRCEVRFTSKPLFNDTYKIDTHLVTGPYMHNRDDEHNRITANDFFTYDLIRQSRLFRLVENEYKTLWDEAEEQLDWEAFLRIAGDFRTRDLREREKVELVHGACVPAGAHGVLAG